MALPERPVPGRDVERAGLSQRVHTSAVDDAGGAAGNMGTQFYDVPAAVEIGSSPWTVLVWCQTFAVPIAYATPA